MKTRKQKVRLLHLLRPLLQLLFFILLPALYINAFTGIKQIYLSIIHSSFSFASLWPQIIETVAIIPITILFGRFFCGWMCAFGALGDFIYLASDKIFKTKFRINEKVDSVLKYVKYIILAFLVIAVWSFGIKTFSTSNPWDVFGLIATVGKVPDFSYAISALTPAFIIFTGIVIGSFFIERFFCRYLCPLGAVFSIASGVRIAKLQKPSDKCGNCRICTKNCAMGIPLYKNNEIKSGECINCFKCISACPRKNVRLTVADEDLRPVIAGAIAVTVITGMYYAGSLTTSVQATGNTVSTAQKQTVKASASSETAQASAAAESSAAAQSASASASSEAASSTSAAKSSATNTKYKDGTYEGNGQGFRGATTTVSVTIKSDKITDVQIVSYGDDKPFFSRAYPSVIDEIINAQSAEVAAVSGATYSSNGIMSAVADALSNAGLKASVSMNAQSTTNTVG